MFFILLSQVVISVAVVAIYHLWMGRNKSPVAPEPRPVAPIATVAPVVSAPALPKVAAAVELPPSSEILAVITAAIAVVLDRPYRVVAVQQATALAPEGNVWAMEGRVEQFLSHRVR